MISASKPNSKALQELVLYYLRERIEENNIDIKYLIATNVYEWYIFEAATFEKLFYRNKAFVKHYEQWRDGQKVTRDTNLFYNDIARPFIDTLTDEITCTHFDVRNYENILRNADKEDDKGLIALKKLLSPNHLLKVPFTNDSNSLINTIKSKTGKDPDDFRKMAEEKGFSENGQLKPGIKAGEIVDWIKNEFGLGHGHAMAIYALLKGMKNEDSV